MPTYIYTPTVPQPNQQINNTQQPIENNFQYIYDLLGVNHVPFNTANTFGEHNFVTYVQNEIDPSTAANEMALYSKPVSDDPNSLELFYRYPSNGSIIQLTGAGAGSSSGSSTNQNTSGGSWAAGTTSSGYKYLGGCWQYTSSGLLMMFGSAYYPAYGTVVQIPVAPGIPTFNTSVFNVQIMTTQSSPVSSGNFVWGVSAVTTTSFTVYCSTTSTASNTIINWVALGI